MPICIYNAGAVSAGRKLAPTMLVVNQICCEPSRYISRTRPGGPHSFRLMRGCIIRNQDFGAQLQGGKKAQNALQYHAASHRTEKRSRVGSRDFFSRCCCYALTRLSLADFCIPVAPRFQGHCDLAPRTLTCV